MGLVAPNVTDARLFCEGLGGWSMNEGNKTEELWRKFTRRQKGYRRVNFVD